MGRNATRRAGGASLTKEMLLPLPVGVVKALSLENHLAFATVRAGQGDVEQITSLLRVVYLSFYLRDETASRADLDLFRRAEAALDTCIERAERGEKWMLIDRERAALECVLTMHDEQLAAVRKHRFVVAWNRLRSFAGGRGEHSPIPLQEEETSRMA